MIELLIAIGIIVGLIGILLPTFVKTRYQAKQILCMNNLRQFAAAGLMYLNDNGKLPAPSQYVPSSITTVQLGIIASYFNLNIPPGTASAWPVREAQPSWINCPFAVDSGMAEGLTLGGGLYTGYTYVGGIEQSTMVSSGFGTIIHLGHSANQRGTNRGVLWADLMDEFYTTNPRRFECFHVQRRNSGYSDFCFFANDVQGIHRAWSDGSVEWVPGWALNLSGVGSPDLQLQTPLGNSYW